MLIACLPLFSVNCINGHDTIYHLLRIEALKVGIQNALPFLRVNMLFFGGEGYASSMFYPDFLLYIPSFCRTAGIGINTSYHIFVAFCIAAGFVSAFAAIRAISESEVAALSGAAAFTLCQYHMDDIYTRGAVGEYTAYIFIPLVLYGIYDLMYKDLSRPYILSIGMVGVLLCHTLTTLMCAALCALAAAVRIQIFIKRPKLLLKAMLCALSSLSLSAFYWLPVLEQMASNTFRYSGGYFDVNYEKLLLREVFYGQSPSMGAALFALILTGLLIDRKGKYIESVRFADFCGFSGALFALCSTGFFPWERLAKYLSFVQFPWRLFEVSSPLLAFAGGIYVGRLISLYEPSASLSSLSQKEPTEKHLSGRGAAFAVFVFMSIFAISAIEQNTEGYYSYSSDYFDYARYTEEVIGGEWLPRSVQSRHRLTDDAMVAYTSDGKKLPVSRYKNTIVVSDLAESEVYIDVPFIYYLGYEAKTPNAQSLKLDGSGENGRVRIYTGGEKSFTVRYAGTLCQRLSEALSIISTLGFASWIILKHRAAGDKEPRFL